MASEEDYKLLQLIAKGDSKSFESLFYKYQDYVYGYSLKVLKNKQLAEDISQEVWMRVIRNSASYKPTSSVKSWIMSIASNLTIDEFRKSKKWIDLTEEQWSSMEDPQGDLEKLFDNKQLHSKLNEAFLLLPENQRVILAMILMEELSQSEVAVRLSISVGAVKAVLFRARENLRKNLEDLNEQIK